MTTKLPQADLQAERGVLGAIMIDDTAFAKCSDYVSINSFYHEKSKIVFKAMLDLYSRNDPVDIVTISAELKKTDKLESIGGEYYLMELGEAVPFPRNVEYYAKIVQEKSLLRRFASISDKSSEESYKPEAKLEDLLDKSIQNLFALQQGTSTEGFESQANLGQEFQLRHSSKVPTGISTGYQSIDYIIGGFKNSELIILAGRPGMGKTSLGLNIASKALSHAGGIIGLISIEMGKAAIQNRFVSNLASVSLYKITERMELYEPEQKRIGEISKNSPFKKLYADYSHSQTISTIRSRARKLKSTTDLKLLVIDYLQIISSSEKLESRAQEVGKWAKELKGLAKELDIPILCLAQVNRDLTGRTNKRPMLNDLKDSGGVEENADMVLFVHRESYYQEVPDDKAEVIVAKNRNGRTGTAHMFWNKRIASFVEEEPPNKPTEESPF